MLSDRPIRVMLCLIAATTLVSCGNGTAEDVASDPRARAFSEWLATRSPLRRGGNGKIDTEVLAVALTRIPVSGEGRWSEKPYLVVWSRFEHLDPTWEWKPGDQPVSSSVTDRDGTGLPEISDHVDPDRTSRALMGDVPLPEKTSPGETFIRVAIHDAPPKGTNELVVRTSTVKPDGVDFELVAVLVPTARIPTLDLAP